MNEGDVLTVSLTASEWNRALTLMGEAPYKVAADLILKIQAQCMQQQRAAPPAKPNGAEAAHAPD